MLLSCLFTASLAQDNLIHGDPIGFRGRKSCSASKICYIFCVQLWPYHFASLSLSFFIHKIGIILFISGLLQEINELKHLKCPLEFLKHNEYLRNIGSTPCPVTNVLQKGSAECNLGAGDLVHALGVCSRCASTTLGWAVYILIYVPNRNRITVVRKMWPSCFYLGKTSQWYKNEDDMLRKYFSFFLINSLLFVSLYFIMIFFLPLKGSTFFIFYSPKRQWTWVNFLCDLRYLPSHELMLLMKKAEVFQPLSNLSVLVVW